MFKRAALTFSELTMWLFMLAILLGGCARSIEDNGSTSEGGVTAESTTTDTDATKTLALDEQPLIPRDVLFGNPERSGARLSPDGKWLSFQAPVDGVMNVWVAPVDDIAKAQPVTEEKVVTYIEQVPEVVEREVQIAVRTMVPRSEASDEPITAEAPRRGLFGRWRY